MKVPFFFSAIIVMSVLTACQQMDEPPDAKAHVSPETAIQRGDVVNLHGKTSNLDRFEKFLSSLDAGKKDDIRITSYTTEGDPIFYNLKFDGEKIHYTYDITMDAYAGTGKGIREAECADIASTKTEGERRYELSGCNSNAGESFLFTVREPEA
ncbi:protein of unknown function [Thalassobacillus cyri]|uniref:DUF4362 domain-containing protein n=1 Tax=Thalassobacillus cyri TaxID=571932 RepID=A0A1H4FMA7_9BACI|nr:DUF4362 domain-containing protein [Thalassobacillus cyri]SEA98503.1 protein of unknown function [Thalassobacillus cyri]